MRLEMKHGKATYLTPATPDDAIGITDLREAVAKTLTERHGEGLWSRGGTLRSVLFDMRRSKVFVVREGERVIASLALGPGGFYVKCGFRETGRVSYRGCPLIYYEVTV